MKRSNLLFFALTLLFTVMVPSIAQAQFVVNSARIILNDNNGNGFANVGDSIIIEVQSANTLGNPTVNLSAIGGSNAEILIQNGGVYQTVAVPLNFKAPPPNYALQSFTVSGWWDNGGIPTNNTQVTVNAIFFDLVQVSGTGATASRAGNTLTVSITDNNYQAQPNPGTAATVNLTPVGGANNAAMVSNGAGGFTLDYTLPDGTDYVGPFTISLKDPINVHPAINYTTNNLTVDNTFPNFLENSATILSGNTVARPGDRIQLKVRVGSYDNDSTTVTAPLLVAAAASPAINNPTAMTLTSASGPGQPAEWTMTVELRETNLAGTVPITFTVTDNAGNVSIRTVEINVDLQKPSIITATATSMQPDGLVSTITDIATSTCFLRFFAELNLDTPPDSNITVFTNLTSIGGSNEHALVRLVDGIASYQVDFTIPQGTLEDGLKHQFTIYARDGAGNIVARATTPPIGIDSNPPTITGVQMTSANPTSTNIIRAGDSFSIQCTITGIENGAATVDLSAVGLLANAPLTTSGSNIYRGTWTLPDSRVSAAIPAVVDGYTSFKVSVNDTVNSTLHGANRVGHLYLSDTNQLVIDNEPPLVATTAYVYQHTLFPADANGFLRVGDTISFYAQVASAPVSVKINMLNLGQGNSETMWLSTNPAYPSDEGWYEYTLPGTVPEGVFNRENKTFRVTATDDSASIHSSDILVPIDNKPVQVSSFDLNVTYINSPADDTDQSIINLNKSLAFTVTLNLPVPADLVPDPNGASIDLSKFGLTSTEAMTYDGLANAYTYSFDNTTAFNFDSASHKFIVTIKDQSGNRTSVQSSMRRVDNWRPEILSATASLPLGGTRAKIGDTILFKVEVKDNESVAPVINLANLGLSNAQAMTLVSTTSGVSLYQHSAIVTNGTINGDATSWTVTARDNDLNYDTAITAPLIPVDSLPPQMVSGLTITGSADPDNIKLGESLTFTVELSPADTTIGTVTVDMRPIGLGASETLPITGSTAARTVTSMLTTTEYTNYRFTANITDTAGNKITSQSQVFTNVDCQPTIINSHGSLVWQDNGTVNPGFAGPGDVLMVWANTSNYADAAFTANLGSGSPVVDFATATMIYNATTNRHEATFTVATATPVGTWNPITEAPAYRITAIDNVNNIASISGLAGYTVRNTAPVIDFGVTQIILSPNRYQASTTSDVLVYNLATDTVGDRLIANIAFDSGLPMHKAWLDFSEFGSGTIDLIVSGNAAETPPGGIAVSRLPNQENVSGKVYVYAIDQAGNINNASRSFIIDNVAPTLAAAEFDGDILSVTLSEWFANNTFVVENWQIVGSSTTGTPLYLDFIATPPVQTLDWSSFELNLEEEHLRVMSQWASTPIYLKVTNTFNATSAVTDLLGNELRPVSYFPITITDSTWREPAKISQFTMTHNWPASITLDLFFNKAIASSTFIASSGVLLINPITYDFTNVDYTTGYVFQASDTISWLADNHLRIILSTHGRDWVASKLGNGASQLRFAIRSSWHTLAYDTLGKPVSHIPTTAPLAAVDNRPTAGFGFSGPPAAPHLNIGNKTLTLTAIDRLRLYNSDFQVASETIPIMALPTPTTNTRVTGFHGKAVLYDIDSGNSTTLQLSPLEVAVNNEYASHTVTLKLTDSDLQQVLSLYQANATPIWRMTIGSGAFTNLWGTPSNPYLPSGNPGDMTLTNGTPTEGASIAAFAMSDKPPVSGKLAGEMFFEVEVFPPNIDGIVVPIQWQNTPTVEFRRQDTSAWVASGTFVSYSERTVNGRLRGIFRYSNNVALPAGMQGVPALVNVYGVRDIFGNSVNLTASYAYDLNTRNDTAVEGYTDTASAPVVIDTQLPVVSSIIPSDYIGKIPAGSIFRVNFDEIMDAAAVPTLSLATSAQTIGFNFTGWTATATAEFTNNVPFTADLPNGIWYYQVSGGRDTAGNNMLVTGATALPVEVRTYAPEVAAGKVILRTVQSTVSGTSLINQPWSPYVGEAEFSIEYTNPPTQNLPHYLQIYNSVTNEELGIVDIQTDGTVMATATFFALSPGTTGPTNYSVRVVDSVNNRTEALYTLVYDGRVPDMTAFNLTGTGLGSSTAEFTYFRQQLGNLSMNLTANTTDTLRLAVYPEGGATSTQLLNAGGLPGTYNIATGSVFANGTYTLTIVDLAGNIGTGSATRKVIADNTAPTLTAIVPEYSVGQPGPYYIGKCNAGDTRLQVSFSEPMDADSAQLPVLTIATTTTSISMEFVSWVDPLSTVTAVYRNINPVTATMPTGVYTCRMTGGRDLAFNTRTPATDQNLTINIYTAGPYASITNTTDQSHIYGTGPQTNLAFNPAYGPAGLRIDFIGGMIDTYDLVVFDGLTRVGTYTGLPDTNPANILFEENPPNASWTWEAGHPTDGTYSLRVRDSEDSFSQAYSFRYDTVAPVIDTPITMAGLGIATDTELGYDAMYHSPAAGAATFTVTTTNSDLVRLLVATGVSTHTADTTPGGTTHQAVWSALSGIGSLADGQYLMTAVDLAGNPAVGTSSASFVVVDSAAPDLIAAYAIINSAPSFSTGVIATGSGVFELVFSEGMNTAITPVLTLSSGTTSIAMTLTGWVSSTTCRFTNATAINKSFAPGAYSFIISGGRDFAGNKNNDTVDGMFQIDLFTEEPDLSSSQLVSRQEGLYGALDLINRPLSFEPYGAEPDIATLTINYRTASGHPFQVPHLIRIYNGSNVMVSETTVSQFPTAATNEITIDAAMLGNPGAATGTFSFRLVDSIGNISATYTSAISYDGIRPTLLTAAVSNVSDAISLPLFYNEQIHGNLNVSYSAGASDSLVLVISGINPVATATFAMTTNTSTGVSICSVPVASSALLAEGSYWITAADMAGNIADGAASTTLLVVDRTSPSVVLATTTSGLPVMTCQAGETAFTVQFSEIMNDMASATPVLVIASGSSQINCTFSGWVASDTALFVNAAAISNTLPQGEYSCRVIGWDLTGNKLDNSSAATMNIRSRGPVIASIITRSYQSTTASSTLASGNELLADQPFSFNVAPGAATLSLQLAATPDGDPNLIHLHFILENSTVASYPVNLTANAGTFTWSITSGPQPTVPTTYQIRLADSNGDLSLESHSWRLDNASPTVNSLTFTGGENNTASTTIYFNPFRHPSINPRFSTAETEIPRMRVRSSISTDTYALSSAGTNLWSTSFTGVFSRSSGSPLRLPDGRYDLGLVDRAGNLAIASGSENLYTLVIDTQSPVVATYSMYVASQPVSLYYSPTAGNLDVFVFSTTDPLTATGVFYLEVLNLVGTRINKLPLVASAGGYLASWNGKNDQGNLVTDGEYTFRATDYAGNVAATTIKTYAMTTEFKVTGATQISSTTAQIWFNHDLNGSSITTSSVTASPALTISNIRLTNAKAISFDSAAAFAHATSYTFTVASGSAGIKNVYNSTLTDAGNQAVMLADGQGPKIVDHSFAGLTSQKEFKVIFDEFINATQAASTSAYILKNASGTTMAISEALPQPDQKTVLLIAVQALTENQNYTIEVSGITDAFGNAAPAGTYGFQGRDLTAPVLVVSAFSNPANENDIIVLATSNEILSAAPILSVKHGTAAAVSTTMQVGAGNKAFMAGVSLNAANGSTGTLLVQGTDLSGNQGTGEGSFSIAYISASMVAQVLSTDSRLRLSFSSDSLKTDATVKILQHRLEKDSSQSGLIKASLQNEYRAARGIRASQTGSDAVVNNSELIPVSDGYEVSIAADKVNKGFSVSLAAPAATSTTGLALFNQNGNTWKFVTADLNDADAFTARAVSSQIFAVMRDVAAPRINMAEELDLTEPFRDSRPEFTGQIEEAGAGLDGENVTAHIDGGQAQQVQVGSDGRFVFRPMAELTGGSHELVIKASDRTGNRSQTAALRFQIQVPLSIGQIMQYPNPASRRGFIRISANRGDLNDDLVKVTIYDVAGHKVTSLDNVRAVKETWNGVNSRFLYDIAWDLRNEDGRQVANGVYFARIEVRDPDNPSAKIKKNFKMAVLR